ncbi:uncharacterized protein LOC143293754 [Babylonia areolata]|uniref:uncharacterized protein LOC143293754 n=1 Tax=Babylonia areolata TaxID=304850 RepID=UPI003FD3985C
MSGPRYGSRYGTSKGVFLNRRGYFNHVPVHNYLSGDGKSHVYMGPGYYVPSERAWLTFAEYRSLPRETRRDAILMESEDQWREFQLKRDKVHQPSGISLSGQPDLYRRNPLPQLVPFRTKAWIRKWDGPGYFYPPSDTWVHEQFGPGVPRDSYRFHNEEDWIKFKYMSETPTLNTLRSHRTSVPLPPTKM